jgi:hypothetical protein
MKSKLRNEIVVATVAAIGAAIAADVFGWLDFKSYLTAGWSGLVSAWGWLGTTAAIPHWLVGLMGLATAACIVLPIYVFFSDTKAQADAMFERVLYMDDTFHEVRWRWSWSEKGSITDLAAFCPHCDLQIVPRAAHSSGSGTMLSCRECRKDLAAFADNWGQAYDEVKMMIQRNMRRRAHEAAVAKAKA